MGQTVGRFPNLPKIGIVATKMICLLVGVTAEWESRPVYSLCAPMNRGVGLIVMVWDVILMAWLDGVSGRDDGAGGGNSKFPKVKCWE